MIPGAPSLSYQFRPMQLEDVPQVYALDVLSFTMPWSERSYRFELTENRHALLYVIEAQPDAPALQTEETGHPIVGMLVIWIIVDEAHIATIAVHPDHQGLGLGKQLLARGLLIAYERGARLAYLEVRRSNLVAQSMYRRFGFEVVGERPRYYQDNFEDALLMTLAELKPERLQPYVK